MSYAEAKHIAIDAIPVIDIGPLRTDQPEALRSVARDMRLAAEHTGFFYIKNHGVPDAVIDSAQTAAQAFFALPLDEKQQVKVNRQHRGFIRIGEARMYDQANIDLKESFIWGLDVADDDADYQAGNPLLGPNQWPASLPQLRAALNAYYRACHDCGRRLLQAFAVGLDIAPDYFIRCYDKPISRGSIIYYPPQPPDLGREQFGVAPHTDYGCITLLYQDRVGGLQVKSRDGEWLTAHPIADTLVVNIGDLLARWSNDRFTSTPHRVVNRASVNRYAMAVFIDPDFDTLIKPVCKDGETAHYPAITCGEYILSRLNKSFAYRK